MRAGKTTHIFQIGDSSVKFSSNFDSGNLRNVLQIAPFHYELQPALDSYEFPSTSKSFFHFFTEGFPPGAELKLVFRRLALLGGLKEDAYRYRPFRSFDGKNYERLSEREVEVRSENEGLTLIITIMAMKSCVYFSFALPYSYERYLNMIRDLPSSNEEMYIHKEVLCYSNNLNLVYVVSIASTHKGTEFQEKIGESTNSILLPQKHLHPPKKYFQQPVILISSRVHPGETSSSWAVEGILKFLTSEAEEAKLIRKHFQVVVVPMLNPDGVEQGLYRLDSRGYNLNRYYLTSDNRQPSIYCMKHLIQHYHETKRLLYYFDLHGHPSQKGSFVYGNALDELPFQVQTELFARLLTLNCPTFEEKFCIFDRDQMNSKDKNDQYTKEGCARVFAFRVANIMHSYTVEMGFHGLSDPNSSLLYSAEDYYKQGRAILTSVLMSCGLKELPEFHSLRSLRKQLTSEICLREERFKREERHLHLKKQQINEIIENEYWRPILQQHFAELSKPRQICLQRMRLKVNKKNLFTTHLQSFFSENLKEEKGLVEEKQEKKSLKDLFEPKGRLETTNITFKLHRTNHSLNSTNTTKELDSPVSKKAPKLAKLVTKSSLRQPTSQPLAYNQRFRSLRKTGVHGFEARMFTQEQQSLFGDINLRPEIGPRKMHRNKIHSLFIDAHN